MSYAILKSILIYDLYDKKVIIAASTNTSFMTFMTEASHSFFLAIGTAS